MKFPLWWGYGYFLKVHNGLGHIKIDLVETIGCLFLFSNTFNKNVTIERFGGKRMKIERAHRQSSVNLIVKLISSVKCKPRQPYLIVVS